MRAHSLARQRSPRAGLWRLPRGQTRAWVLACSLALALTAARGSRVRREARCVPGTCCPLALAPAAAWGSGVRREARPARLEARSGAGSFTSTRPHLRVGRDACPLSRVRLPPRGAKGLPWGQARACLLTCSLVFAPTPRGALAPAARRDARLLAQPLTSEAQASAARRDACLLTHPLTSTRSASARGWSVSARRVLAHSLAH